MCFTDRPMAHLLRNMLFKVASESQVQDRPLGSSVLPSLACDLLGILSALGTRAPSPTQSPSLPGPGSDSILAVSLSLILLFLYSSSSCPGGLIYSCLFSDQSSSGLQRRGSLLKTRATKLPSPRHLSLEDPWKLGHRHSSADTSKPFTNPLVLSFRLHKAHVLASSASI